MPSRANQQSPFAAFWTQYGRAILGVCVFVLFLHDIFGAHGYLAMRRTKREIEKVQADIARLDKENLALAGEIKDLKTDPRTIEKIARCELNLAKPGEVIIKIPGQPQSCDEPIR